MTNVNNLIPLLDHAAAQGDRWLFLSAMAVLLIFAWLVIRWLVKRTEAQNRSLEVIANNQNETAQRLAVVISQNTEAMQDCMIELKHCREIRS